MSRTDVLHEGVEILNAVMQPAKFRFEQVHDGAYLCGRYRRADRTLELHFSDSLRLVSQRVGDVVVMHDDFMRALLDPRRFTITHDFLQLDDARRDARSAFASHDFAKVVSLYQPLERELMPAERRRLAIARGPATIVRIRSRSSPG